MRVSSDLRQGLPLQRRECSRGFPTCGALLLFLGACGSTKHDPGGEATGSSVENGGAPPVGGADASGGARSGGAGAVGLGGDGGATDRAAGGGGETGGSNATGGGNPTGGGGNPAGGAATGGGTPIGGAGGAPAGGVGGLATGGASTGGSGGAPAGGTRTGGGSGLATGGASTGGSGGASTGGSGGAPTGGSGGTATGGVITGGAEAAGAETGGAMACDDPGTPRSGGMEFCVMGDDDLANGYHYQFWSSESGSACMTVFGDDATFKCDWSGTHSVLGQVGLSYDATQTPDQIGTFSADFAVTGSATGLVFLGVYGYTTDPRLSFYVIEDWVNDHDGTAPVSGASLGTISVDGGTYSVYRKTVGQSVPPRQEYYSVRTEGRRCGHTSISEHFAQWAELEMPLGLLGQVSLFVDGEYQGSGSIEFTRATVTVQ
ncbi:MAG: glycoside hydrolase family 11 protein [Polyangiaceae bacterium]|nr:glycoside hydrolase family 11 protein [Polyangiaceae bacterium]